MSNLIGNDDGGDYDYNRNTELKNNKALSDEIGACFACYFIIECFQWLE